MSKPLGQYRIDFDAFVRDEDPVRGRWLTQDRLNPNPVFGPINTYYDQALQASQKAHSTTSLHAIQYLEQYLNGIITQWNRIVIATYQWPISPPAEKAPIIRKEELDFHFYLICWDKVLKYFGLVEKIERDIGISKAFRKVARLLHDAKEGRNFYEHLDREFRKGGIGTRGRGFSSPEGYHFSYIRIIDGRRVERKANLGMEEIGKIGEAYEDVIAILKARGDTHT